MSGVEMQDSWSIAPPIETDSSHNQVTMREWGEAYGLIPRLIPFEQRPHDPIEILGTIREYIDEMPQTAATFRLSYFEDEFPQHPVHIPSVEPLLEMLGSWDSRVNPNSNLERRWANPGYVHLKSFEPNVTDPGERREIVLRAAEYGLLQLPDIAPRFGMETNSLTRWVTRNGISWNERRVDGIGRVARTCATIDAWTEWTQVEIARALGVPASTLRRWISSYAYDSAFEVPQDPSGEPWFTRRNFDSEGSR